MVIFIIKYLLFQFYICKIYYYWLTNMLIVFEFVVIVIGTVESVFNENGVFETISAANVIFAG